MRVWANPLALCAGCLAATQVGQKASRAQPAAGAMMRMVNGGQPRTRVLRKAIEFQALCQLALSVSGCAPMIQATVSVPQVPANATGEVSDEVLHLKLAGLTLSTQMFNYHPTSQKGQPPVGLWLELDAQDDTFTFDPGLVTLTAGNGSPARPITILGPATSWKSPRSVAMGCGPRIYSWGWAWHKIDVSNDDIKKGNPAKGVWKESPGYVPVKTATCFMLTYDISPDPDQTFVLSINGARRYGSQLSIPDISFSKGSIRKSMAVP